MEIFIKFDALLKIYLVRITSGQGVITSMG